MVKRVLAVVKAIARKKRWVLRNSKPCGQDCKHTDPVGFWLTWAVCWLDWAPPSPAQSAVMGMSSHATDLVQLRCLVLMRNLFLFLVHSNIKCT